MNQKTLAIFSSFCLITGLGASESVVKYALKQGLAQGSLLLKAKKIQTLIKDPLLPEKTKEALLLSQEVLSFAKKIPMKTGAAYTKYVELKHDWVTQVVVAAKKDQLVLKSFDFPIVGSFPYKGYFDEEDAIAEEQELAKKYDVFRRKVPAFSSLGWFSDPLTSNLLKNEYVLVETLFHELVHLSFYFDQHSDFNEAFATWYSYKASGDFLKEAKHIHDKDAFKLSLQESLSFDAEINAFIEEIKSTGDSFYSKKDSAQQRDKYFIWIKNCTKKYPNLKNFDKFEWNNAAVLSFSTYTRLIPAIEKYAEREKLNYRSFLEEVLKQGPEIISKIEKIKTETPSRRCDAISP